MLKCICMALRSYSGRDLNPSHSLLTTLPLLLAAICLGQVLVAKDFSNKTCDSLEKAHVVPGTCLVLYYVYDLIPSKGERGKCDISQVRKIGF